MCNEIGLTNQGKSTVMRRCGAPEAPDSGVPPAGFEPATPGLGDRLINTSGPALALLATFKDSETRESSRVPTVSLHKSLHALPWPTHGAVLISDPSPAIADRIRHQRPRRSPSPCLTRPADFAYRRLPPMHADSDGCGVPMCGCRSEAPGLCRQCGMTVR